MENTEKRSRQKPTAADLIREKVEQVAQTIRDLDPLACDSSLCLEAGKVAIETHRGISRAKGDH